MTADETLNELLVKLFKDIMEIEGKSLITDEFKDLAKNANYTPYLEDGQTVKQIILDTADLCKEAYDKYYAQ